MKKRDVERKPGRPSALTQQHMEQYGFDLDAERKCFNGKRICTCGHPENYHGIYVGHKDCPVLGCRCSEFVEMKEYVMTPEQTVARAELVARQKRSTDALKAWLKVYEGRE